MKTFLHNWLACLLMVGVGGVLTLTSGCKSVPRLEREVPVANLAAELRDRHLEIRVDAEQPVQAKFVEEYAWRELPGALPVTQDGPFNGTVDILFSTTPEAVESGFSNMDFYGRRRRMSAFGDYHGTTRVNQRSTTMLVIKDEHGRRLWTGLHRGYEMNDADAARVAMREIAAQLRIDVAAGATGGTAAFVGSSVDADVDAATPAPAN